MEVVEQPDAMHAIPPQSSRGKRGVLFFPYYKQDTVDVNLAACVHRDFVLDMDGNAPSAVAENVADCQRECQKNDFCEVFFYYPR